MNSRLIATGSVAVSMVIGGLVSGCTKSASDTTGPKTDCRIERVLSTVKNVNSSGTQETVYTYDSAGNLLEKVQTNQYQYTSGASQTTTLTEQYSYDANQFLSRSTATTVDKNSIQGKLTTYQLTSAKDYRYTDGRLAAYTQTDVVNQSGTSAPQAQTTVTTSAYQYDAAGQLTKQTFSDGLTLTYQNGQVTAYSGTFPFTVENGLVTKASFPGTNSVNQPTTLVQLNQYDQQRRLIKHEEFINQQLDRYYTQAWQAGKPATASLPLFKGHPTTQSPFGESGLMTAYNEYFVNHQQGEQPYAFSETLTTHQLNAQGFVSRSTSQTTYFTNGQKEPDQTTTVYTYTGCN